MILMYGIFVLAILYTIKYLRKLYNYRKPYFKLPTVPNYNYTKGTLHQFPGHNEEGMSFEMSMAEKCRYFHVEWLGPLLPLVVIYHPDVVRPVLKSSAPKPRNIYLASAYDMIFRWLGEGLLIANGSQWAKSRRLITPAFHFDILKQYVDVYNQCGSVLVQRIKDLSKGGDPIDVYPLLSFDALDIVLRCAFSKKSNCQISGFDGSYVQTINQIQNLWVKRMVNTFHFNELIYRLTPDGKKFYQLCDVAHQYADDVITKRRKELDADQTQIGHRKVKDFLDTLLTTRDGEGNGLSPLEIRNEVDTFLFEGHDTTASAMTWTLYALAQHPEYQERVYEEVMEVLQGREYIEWKDLPKLEFTTMCIKESMRLHTTVPFIERQTLEDCHVHGHTIPAGSRVAIQLYVLHHHPEIWEDPFVFRPERFGPDNQNKMDPFQFVPFSAGPRNCIGQNFAMNEMKTTIGLVIKNFELSLDPKQKARRLPIMTMKPENGVFVHATLRK